MPLPRVSRRSLVAWALAGVALTCAAATEPTPAPRVTATYEGILFQHDAGQEELARALAVRLLAWNRQISTQASPAAHRAPPPLSADDMRINEQSYLRAVAHQLALRRPTDLQVECYGAFLRNYELTARLLATMREQGAQAAIIHRVTLWNREGLVRRLTAGEKIPGFAWDPKTGTGSTSFGINVQGTDDRLKTLMQERATLHRRYQLSLSPATGGGTTYRAMVSPMNAKTALDEPASTASSGSTPNETDLFPVVVPPEVANKPVTEQVSLLWDRPEQGIGAILGSLRQLVANIPTTDPHLAFLLLHETTELGIVDRYLRGPDRRWFCDGVANYVAWRTIRDRHGAEAAKAAYNLPDELGRYAKWKSAADLSRWPAVENESKDEITSELELARYVFATNAVMLMNARAGEDILPRLFRELGKQKAGTANYAAVESSWRKLTGSDLRVLVTDATR